MEIVHFFLEQHARTHAARVSGAAEPMPVDRLLEGLSDDQLRARPRAGMNSLCWTLWHMARIEDVTINMLVARRPPVFDATWATRLGTDREDVGTGMNDDEVSGLSVRIDIAALHVYRAAVGNPAVLQEPVDAEGLQSLRHNRSLAAGADWLAAFWSGKTKAFVLQMPATGHSYLHIGGALLTRQLLEDGWRHELTIRPQ